MITIHITEPACQGGRTLTSKHRTEYVLSALHRAVRKHYGKKAWTHGAGADQNTFRLVLSNTAAANAGIYSYVAERG